MAAKKSKQRRAPKAKLSFNTAVTVVNYEKQQKKNTPDNSESTSHHVSESSIEKGRLKRAKKTF